MQKPTSNHQLPSGLAAALQFAENLFSQADVFYRGDQRDEYDGAIYLTRQRIFLDACI